MSLLSALVRYVVTHLFSANVSHSLSMYIIVREKCWLNESSASAEMAYPASRRSAAIRHTGGWRMQPVWLWLAIHGNVGCNDIMTFVIDACKYSIGCSQKWRLLPVMRRPGLVTPEERPAQSGSYNRDFVSLANTILEAAKKNATSVGPRYFGVQ